MSDLNHPTSDLIYQLDDKPRFSGQSSWCGNPFIGLFVRMVMLCCLIVAKLRIYPPIPQLIWFLVVMIASGIGTGYR